MKLFADVNLHTKPHIAENDLLDGVYTTFASYKRDVQQLVMV